MRRVLFLFCLACGGSHGSSDAGLDADLEPRPDAQRPSDGGVSIDEGRFADRAIVKLLPSDEDARWWIEERIAPQPEQIGDRDLGPRAIVRAAEVRTTVWLPPTSDRLVDACRHDDGTWSAVGVDDAKTLFVAHGDTEGLRTRASLDDPSLRDEPRAWIADVGEGLRIGALSEASPKIVCDAGEAVVSVMSDQNAVLLYRLGTSTRRTLVAPATIATPFLPIGGSYDDFDATVAPFATHLALGRDGRVFVAWLADRSRVRRYDEVFDDTLSLVRETLPPNAATLDTFVVGIDRDGSRAFAAVVGVPDVEDEVFTLAASDTRVAVVGRHRRELGRDNTELHGVVAELDHDGVSLGARSLDLEDSAVALAAAYDGDVLYVGGSAGWNQNPSGRSVFRPGSPFLLRVEAGEVAALDVPETSGHAELRAIRVDAKGLTIAGSENGPLTHTGDADRSRIRCDAWWQRR